VSPGRRPDRARDAVRTSALPRTRIPLTLRRCLANNFNPLGADKISLMVSIDGVEIGVEKIFSKYLAQRERSWYIGTCKEPAAATVSHSRSQRTDTCKLLSILLQTLRYDIYNVLRMNTGVLFSDSARCTLIQVRVVPSLSTNLSSRPLPMVEPGLGVDNANIYVSISATWGESRY
jgi:hypothetical protein